MRGLSAAEVREVLVRRRELRFPSLHTIIHRGEHIAHNAYMSLVGVYKFDEWYGKAAIAVVVLVVVSFFVHEEEL